MTGRDTGATASVAVRATRNVKPCMIEGLCGDRASRANYSHMVPNARYGHPGKLVNGASRSCHARHSDGTGDAKDTVGPNVGQTKNRDRVTVAVR